MISTRSDKLGRLLQSTIYWLACLAWALAASLVQAESLYRPDHYRALTADSKAYRVGDVLTVQVMENASATTNADTTTRRGNDLDASLTLSRNPTISGGIALHGDFDGGGRTQRAGRLLASLSVTVREILPNGDLRVSGEQELLINDEQQKISLEGRVRPRDISDGNVVLSSRLADARINYIGEGDLTERQRRGWWRKLLDWLGL